MPSPFGCGWRMEKGAFWSVPRRASTSGALYRRWSRRHRKPWALQEHLARTYPPAARSDPAPASTNRRGRQWCARGTDRSSNPRRGGQPRREKAGRACARPGPSAELGQAGGGGARIHFRSARFSATFRSRRLHRTFGDRQHMSVWWRGRYWRAGTDLKLAFRSFTSKSPYRYTHPGRCP